MSLRRIPVLPTLLVLLAVGVMVRLGFWQLDRMHEKEALLARYEAAQANRNVADWDGDPAKTEMLLYRRARIHCVSGIPGEPAAGKNSKGQMGWAQIEDCVTSSRSRVRVVMGWCSAPYCGAFAPGTPNQPSRLTNATVVGVIAPGPRLVANPPLAVFGANAVPDPGNIPNNHFAYAVQWFLFATTALAIYALALRKRLRG